MKIFITGATGYIGGSIAHKLIEEGHEVHGLVRAQAKVAALEEMGVRPVLGSLDDREIVDAAARRADAVINAASSDHREVVETMVRALAGSEKPLIHTSGSSIVADDAGGDVEGTAIYHDDSHVVPTPLRAARVALDRFVRQAGIAEGVRAVVICPTMIYGRGRGPTRESDQIPKLTAAARKRGAGVHIGRGVNRWSNVHIDDLVALYLLALEKAPGGSFYFAENGEESFVRLAEAISRSLGFGGRTESWPLAEAVAELGDAARFALASNSRVRAVNARRLLGWAPKGPSVLASIEDGR